MTGVVKDARSSSVLRTISWLFDLKTLPAISNEIHALSYWVTRLFWTLIVELKCRLAAVVGIHVAPSLPESDKQPLSCGQWLVLADGKCLRGASDQCWGEPAGKQHEGSELHDHKSKDWRSELRTGGCLLYTLAELCSLFYTLILLCCRGSHAITRQASMMQSYISLKFITMGYLSHVRVKNSFLFLCSWLRLKDAPTSCLGPARKGT